MQGWLVLTTAALYIAALFLIAWWGERGGHVLSSARARGIAYCLTLAVYNTAWSFYGSVGRATLGFDYLPIYIGPIAVLVFAQPLLRKIIGLAKMHNATSIADFIAIRYGRNQGMAALLTLIALVALLPYIALQLKAVAASFDVLIGGPSVNSGPALPFWKDSAFGVAVSMTVFAIVFGVRHIHASEHHRGLMLAIAFESLVKLATFIVVGGYILIGLPDQPAEMLGHIRSDPAISNLLVLDPLNPSWVSNTVVSIIAFLCLPHMFHVAVVENEAVGDTRRAALLFPAYLLIFSVLMLPIAIVGLVTFGKSVNPDTYMIMLPLAHGGSGIALLAFIGGLSAATGMVIVAAVALSTMLCNDVVMPLLLRAHLIEQRRFSGDISKILLVIRRGAVVAVLMLAYVMHRSIDQRYPLTSIGLLSFVAIAQFGPSLIGGLYWRRADLTAALAGIITGIGFWIYTLLVPSVAALSPAVSNLTNYGPFGIIWLRPHALLGLDGLDPISHAALWSLGANTVAFLALSILRRQSIGARNQAEVFISTPSRQSAPRQYGRAVIRLDDLSGLARRFVGSERGTAAFREYLRTRTIPDNSTAAGLADDHAIRFTETLLAGAIGAASARVVLAASLEGPTLSRGAAMAILDQASEALRFNRKLLEGALESIPQGILVLDRDLEVTAWNHRLVVLLDLPGDFMRVGLRLADLSSFNRERGEYAAADLKALIVNRDMSRQTWPYTYERQRPDGTVLEATYDRMPDEGYIATFTDVTERHRAAAALRAARDLLEERVQARTYDLDRARRAAEDANAGKTRFLASASHDLLQPLNAARLFLAALQEGRNDAGLDRNAMALVDNASAALRSTEELLNTLLDISALDSGATRVQIEQFAVADLFTQLHLEFSALAATKGLTLKTVPSSGIIESDSRLLRRVLQNFLSNGIRYTESGRILLGSRLRGDRLRIEVWDTGAGIPQDRQTEIFEEFHRLRQDEDQMPGHGLGLAIVERIGRKLQHPIGVSSVIGRGSRFHITVPLCARRPSALSPAVHPPGVPAQGKTTKAATVLCIDNEPAILKGMEALLGRWGHEAILADGESKAISVLSGRIPDMVLIDYHLNEMSGLDILDRLRALWQRDVRSLVITADRSEEVVADAAHRGCPVLTKPIKPAALRRFLNGWFQPSATEETEAHLK